MPLGAFKAALMGTAGASAGADVVLLATTTIDDDATVSFTSGIDSTYGEYIWRFYNIRTARTDTANFSVQFSTDGGSNYGIDITSNNIASLHTEDDSTSAYVVYNTGGDSVQSSAFQPLGYEQGAQADASGAGELHLFNPAGTTYAKHFYSIYTFMNASHGNDAGDQAPHTARVGGYVNSAGDIDAIQFKMHSENIASGKIKMWGVK